MRVEPYTRWGRAIHPQQWREQVGSVEQSVQLGSARHIMSGSTFSQQLPWHLTGSIHAPQRGLTEVQLMGIGSLTQQLPLPAHVVRLHATGPHGPTASYWHARGSGPALQRLL